MIYYVLVPSSDNKLFPRHGNAKYLPIPLPWPTNKWKHNIRQRRQSKSRGSLWIKVIQQDILYLTGTLKIRKNCVFKLWKKQRRNNIWRRRKTRVDETFKKIWANHRASKTRLRKNFAKGKLDKITRKPLQCITEFKLIRG